MNIFILGLIVPLLSFLLDVWPRLFKRYFGVDTWRWLFFAEYIRKHKRLPKESPKQFMVTFAFGYPPVILFFLSLFPKKFLEKYQFLFSPVFDLINNYFTFLIALEFSRDFLTAIVAQVATALVPLTVIEASNLNSRRLGVFIFNISFSTLLLFTITSQPVWIIISSISLFILFFTHRFGIQTYLVVVICFTLLERNIFYSLYFLGMFILVYVCGGKLYKAIFREHIECLKFWAGRTEYRFAHQVRGLSKQTTRNDFIQTAYNLSTRNPIFFDFVSNPWLIWVLIISLFGLFNIHVASTLNILVVDKMQIWIWTLFVWSVLVLWGKELQIFGDGQRYIGYCVLPTALVIGSFYSSLLHTFGTSFYLVSSITTLLILCFTVFLQYKTVIRDRSRSITKGVWDVINYINAHNPTKSNLAMFPQQMGDAILYFTTCRILTSDTLTGLKDLADFYPVLKKPMSEIAKKYRINYIYLDRNYVTLEELKLERYKIVVESNDYVLLRIEP